MKVNGKVCVVTGAAGGIGEAVARRYAKEGAKGVVVADMDAGRLDKVAKDIGGLAVAGDIGKESEVRKLITEAEKKYGQVDVFFSNAGWIGSNSKRSPVASVIRSKPDWRSV